MAIYILYLGHEDKQLQFEICQRDICLKLTFQTVCTAYINFTIDAQ